MNIHFHHGDQNRLAKIFCNFKEIKDCILVVFENGFNEDILFYRDKETWVSVSDMQSRLPGTYFNVQTAITQNFKEAANLNDFLLQGFLS